MGAKQQTTAIEKSTATIEKVLETCNNAALASMAPLSQAVTLASGMSQIRNAMTPELVKQVFMPLQGSPLGFVTDQDRGGGYSADVVRDCIIEAMIVGLRPIGNEFNIISGRMYAAKAGMIRLVQEFPGVSDLVVTPGVPHMADKGALVPVHARWLLHGEPQTMVRDVVRDEKGAVVSDTRIPVRVNSGMGSDAIIGKATRKAYKAIYDRLVGSGGIAVTDGEIVDTVGVEQTPPPPPEQDGKRMRMCRDRNPASSPKAADKPQEEPPERQPGEDDE